MQVTVGSMQRAAETEETPRRNDLAGLWVTQPRYGINDQWGWLKESENLANAGTEDPYVLSQVRVRAVHSRSQGLLPLPGDEDRVPVPIQSLGRLRPPRCC